MNAEQIDMKNGRGCVPYTGGILTFEIEGGLPVDDSLTLSHNRMLAEYQSDRTTLAINGKYVVPWGANNLYPQEVMMLISENKLLPEILEKQIEYLYGQGLMVYKLDDDGNKLRVNDKSGRAIQDWLNHFARVTGETANDYVLGLITDYYHVNTTVTRFHFNKSRRIEGGPLPVAALSYIGADQARLALDKQPGVQRILNQECKFVVVADWAFSGSTNATVYPRLNLADPLRDSNAISFNRRRSFSHDVYARNTWYSGLKEWLKASNLTPKYLNSYLRNALNAHVHCRIPKIWYDTQANTIQELCAENCYIAADPNDTRKPTEEYKGVSLIGPDGKPYQYSPQMVQDLVANELRRITDCLSGETNQGKMFASVKIGQEGWEFEKMPTDFKEYFQAVIDYDKRADQVSLAGVGINSSITNVEAEGQLSKSGSDVYYNYIIYLSSLAIAEEFVCRDLNTAISINFPKAYEEGIRIGLDIRMPSKIQDIAPADRIDSQA